MKWQRLIRLTLCILLPLLQSRSHGQGVAPDLPATTNVIARLLARAATLASSTNTEKYAYEKRSVVEELNAHGQTVDATEKTYQVMVVRGWPFSRLTKVQGHALSEEALRREDEREQEFRNKIAGRDLRKPGKNTEPVVTPELLARYEFKVLSRENCQGREALVLEFKPRKSNPETTAQDRIYNRLAGRIWVDDADDEITKLDVHLTDEFSLGWLGMLGSIKQCHLTIERQRMPDGVWVNARQTVLILGRKLVSSIRVRATEQSSNFQRVT